MKLWVDLCMKLYLYNLKSAYDSIISSLLIPLDTNSILIAFLHIYAVFAYQSPSFYWVPENFYNLPISSSLFTSYRILQVMIEWHLLDWHSLLFCLQSKSISFVWILQSYWGSRNTFMSRETHFIVTRIIFLFVLGWNWLDCSELIQSRVARMLYVPSTFFFSFIDVRFLASSLSSFDLCRMQIKGNTYQLKYFPF